MQALKDHSSPIVVSIFADPNDILPNYRFDASQPSNGINPIWSQTSNIATIQGDRLRITLRWITDYTNASMDGLMTEFLDIEEQAPRAFKCFGPSILVQQMRGRIRSIEFPTDRIEARKLIRDKCPLVPGVYGWLDENRQLAYVGKSKALRKRLLSYFAKNPTDSKVQRLRTQCRHIVWEPISHELLALIRETELIHR